MFESPELVLCDKNERVTIFKIPPVSTTKGYYLDDWKEMIWEGGVKVTEKDKDITVTFIGKDKKIFAQTKIPADHTQAIVKTLDSSRGYAVRLEKPNGGYLWIGVAFRDRNDAFDFGVVFQDHSERRKLDANPNALDEQFGNKINFSLKKGEKIKINMKGGKEQNKNADFFNEFNTPNDQKQTDVPTKNEDNWFGDLGTSKPSDNKKKNNEQNLFEF